MYMYTCLILLPVADSGGGGDQVFKTNVFNTHDYKFGLHCSSLLYIAENSVCKSNTSSGGRCWGLEVVKRFRGWTPPVGGVYNSLPAQKWMNGCCLIGYLHPLDPRGCNVPLPGFQPVADRHILKSWGGRQCISPVITYLKRTQLRTEKGGFLKYISH